ncbi:hypothetical protein ACJJTC_001167 [Scirpophaga incertulas]
MQAVNPIVWVEISFVSCVYVVDNGQTANIWWDTNAIKHVTSSTLAGAINFLIDETCVSCVIQNTQDVLPGPPPAYETVVDVDVPSHLIASSHGLQDMVKETCPQCRLECDSELPSYEAAVMLKDTKL